MTAASRESSAATDARGVLKSSGACHIEGGIDPTDRERRLGGERDARCPTGGDNRSVIAMSKHPSPRADQLRAMREAQFAKHQQLQKETEREEAGKPVEPAKSVGKKSNVKEI
jgi:hypothetical protein